MNELHLTQKGFLFCNALIWSIFTNAQQNKYPLFNTSSKASHGKTGWAPILVITASCPPKEEKEPSNTKISYIQDPAPLPRGDNLGTHQKQKLSPHQGWRGLHYYSWSGRYIIFSSVYPRFTRFSDVWDLTEGRNWAHTKSMRWLHFFKWSNKSQNFNNTKEVFLASVADLLAYPSPQAWRHRKDTSQ